jgi:lysine-specific demethylase/histidyl-hydroxylase NO66
MALTFVDCIAPSPLHDFIQCYVAKTLTYLPGPLDRFSRLVTMGEINDLMSRLVVYPGMLRIKKDAAIVPESEYLTAPFGSAGARLIKAASMERYLECGATLIIDQCQSLFAPVSALCDELTLGFKAHVSATLILVNAPGHSASLHWDAHDVFVCQIMGCKRWPVFFPVIEKPLRNNYSGEIASPSKAWDEVLNPGDALYVPRGWPHQPIAIEGPSIHITFDIDVPTGKDVLSFVFNNVLKQDVVRTDLPFHASREDRRLYSAEIRNAIIEAMSDDVLESYYTACQLNVRPTRLQLR